MQGPFLWRLLKKSWRGYIYTLGVNLFVPEIWLCPIFFVSLHRIKNIVIMLAEQTELILSPYTELYNIVVPQTHKLRILKENIDFSFIRNEVKEKYSAKMGRYAEDPVRMFKYLFLKCLYGMSDRGLVERCMSDMAFKYFLDLRPEDEVIDPSLLSVFRRQRLVDMNLLDYLISSSVKTAVELGVIKSRTLIIDATHTCSKYNPYAPVELLQLRSKKLRHSIYINTKEPDTYRAMFPKKPVRKDLEEEIAYSRELISVIREKEIMSDVPAVVENLNLLEETIGDIEDHFTSSVKDSDARLGHKSEDAGSFLGYKTHMAMTPEMIVTAATVTTGEKPDGKEMKELVNKSKSNLGATEEDQKVDDILADGAYSGDDNLKFANKEKIALYARPNPMLYKSNESKGDGFELNKDAGMYTCPAGHLAISKSVIKYKKGKGNDRLQFKFDPEKCKCCKLRDTCLSKGAKSRYYSIPIRSSEQDEQMKFSQTPIFKERIKERYKIEQKNAILKNVYGYRKTLSFGIESMRIQGAVAIYVSNIMRILKLKEEKV